jgi:DNA invertase Pin-like site-specific DNA recombinase
MAIVRTYVDEGKSGLNIVRRDALKQLIEDVQSGAADFKIILVFDVSRWGRFQDADESAHYEYICRRAGMRFEYCFEQFENDGSLSSTLIKSIKRAMAGEFSRDRSALTFSRQSRIVKLGFRLGGSVGYGLRRMLIDQHGVRKCQLEFGQHKAIVNDRVILVPGPPEEV